ncbi:hypothetical protein HOA55_01645 [archaeon]|jgi:hypothetical protein|nr:hypothetical protein [archaeon]MBT3577695.1 hypothetical protein [archaeon]MBT6820038.1 hypothetical protein [archaeon]MBT6955945.1 hypothetical protein [archaeon]MBT7025361.1 hypothetical protein [archaeon]
MEIESFEGMNTRGDMKIIGVIAIFVFGILGMFLVGAVTWDGSDVNYNVSEDTYYYHDLSANISGFNNDITFSIDTAIDNKINWTNSTGSFLVFPSEVSEWISITNSTTGNLTINATNDNQTGYFIIPIQAVNDTNGGEGAITNFEFNISAVNDAPYFVGLSNQIFNSLSENTYEFNVNDEENNTPYNLTLNFTSCSVAEWSDRDCDTASGRELFNSSYWDFDNITGTWNLTFTPAKNDVGNYTLNVSVTDNSSSVNQTNWTLVNFTVRNVNVAPSFTYTCDSERNATEDILFNCLINATDEDETSELNFTINQAPGGFIFNNSLSEISVNCDNDTGFNSSANISFTANDSMVGNWSINISVTDSDADNPQSTSTVFWFSINNTADSPVMGNIDNQTVYENITLNVTGYDDDLLITSAQRANYYNESLTFATNESWVTVGSLITSGTNYTIATLDINYDYVENNGTFNYSVIVNVTDTAGNTDNQTFIIEINTDYPPVWNTSLDDIVQLSLTEDTAFNYNVSVNVSDVDNDTITFYYVNNSAEFCSLNSSTFNSTSGMISFTPTDCDVGYHNVTIIASDGMINRSKEFNFSIENVEDTPVIDTVFSATNADEDSLKEILFYVYDDDFLIPYYQRANYYDESLTVDTNITNLTAVTSAISFDFSLFDGPANGTNISTFKTNFTPDGVNVGDYNVTINITDAGGNYTSSSFILNITATGDAPILGSIENHSLTVNDILLLDINSTDEEDGDDSSGNLTYSLNFTSGTDFVGTNETIFNTTTGILNFTFNSSHAGEYHINVTVNDSTGLNDSQEFRLYVYGMPDITSPITGYVFNWTEGNSTGDLDFNVSYGVNDTNLTYLFYLDNIVYSNFTHFNYTNLTLISSDNLRNETNWTWVRESNFSWNFTPTYSDETYGMLKNLTLMVYNPDYPELNDSINWKVNISHTNENVSFSGYISDQGPISAGAAIEINLSEYFSDADYFDKTLNQTVNFTLTAVSGGSYVAADSSFSDWILSLSSPVATIEVIRITAYEYNSSNISIGNASSNDFQVEVVPATTTTVTRTGGGGGTSKLKHYSLKLIVPQDVIISEQNYIDVPFSVDNNGQVDLVGINLSSTVSFENVFSDDLSITFEDGYIEELKINQSENFSMRIYANTQRSGKYRATIQADVESPMFSDWAEFIIDLRETNETEAEQILIFTEKLIAENSECLELTELLKAAEQAFNSGDFALSLQKSQDVVGACETAIKANEQVRYGDGVVGQTFYYASFATLSIFFIGLVFYIYKRVRFNKSKINEYI